MSQLPPLLEKLDIRFDPNEAYEFYCNLENRYRQYRWVYGDFNPPVPGNSNYEKMFGWSLNTNNDINNSPNWDHNGIVFKDTPCVTGFGKKIMDFFNVNNYSCVTVFPADTHLGLHNDDYTYKRIHLPLTRHTNFFFFDEHQNKFNTDPGYVYILHTERLHGAKNLGNDCRAHLLIKYNAESISEVYNKQGLII